MLAGIVEQTMGTAEWRCSHFRCGQSWKLVVLKGNTLLFRGRKELSAIHEKAFEKQLTADHFDENPPKGRSEDGVLRALFRL